MIGGYKLPRRIGIAVCAWASIGASASAQTLVRLVPQQEPAP